MTDTQCSRARITSDIIDAATTEWLYGPSRQTTLDLDGAERRWREMTQRELEWHDSGHGRRSRAKYAQRTIDPTEVAEMVRETEQALGTRTDVARFVANAVRALGGAASGAVEQAASTDTPSASLRLGLTGLAGHMHADIAATMDTTPDRLEQLQVRFDTPPPVTHGDEVGIVLARTHPLVGELARHVTDPAMDRHQPDAPAARLAVVATDVVETRTWLLTVRFRFDLDTERRTRQPDGTYAIESATHLAEDVAVVGIRRRGLLSEDEAGGLLTASAVVNLSEGDRRDIAEQTLGRLAVRWPTLLDEAAVARGERLARQHRVARQAVARGRGMGAAVVRAHLRPDVLAVMCLVPVRGV